MRHFPGRNQVGRAGRQDGVQGNRVNEELVSGAVVPGRPTEVQTTTGKSKISFTRFPWDGVELNIITIAKRDIVTLCSRWEARL
jgi:hypothetical protein